MKDAMIVVCACGTHYRDTLETCPKCDPIPEGACQRCRGTVGVRRYAGERPGHAEMQCTACAPLGVYERVALLDGGAPLQLGEHPAPRVLALFDELETLRMAALEGPPVEDLARILFYADDRVEKRIRAQSDHRIETYDGIMLSVDAYERAKARAWDVEVDLRHEATNLAKQISWGLQRRAINAKGQP